MPTLKMWQLLALTFPAYLCGFAMSVEITQCVHAVKDQSCNMTCKVPDFIEVIDINCNGTSRGTCLSAGCSQNMHQEGGDTVYLHIPSLSYTTDNCKWTCAYGATLSLPLTFIIYSGISGGLIITNQTNEDKINLTATAECVYPYNTTVRVQYREEQDTSEKYQYLTQQLDVQSYHVPGNCGYDFENSIVATYEVSRKNSLLGGKSVFLRMEFLQYISATPNYTDEVGPFTFVKSSDSEGCKYSDVELIFGGVSCFLIVLITSIIMLIIQGCKILLEIFGDIKPNKVIIIIVFDFVALIIGLALGFSLKECDQRDLGLGLGLGFGFILAIALVVTLYIYHKKCGSKKGVPRRAMEYISCTQSGQ